MLIQFSVDKLIQAAAILLKATPPERMSYLRLLKLLYIADRESIQETGRPITGDEVVAMQHGPVLSRAFDCVKGTDYASQEWGRYIQRSGPYDIELVQDPGVARLSRYEVMKLQDVSRRHEELDQWELVEVTHQFEEWVKNQPDAVERSPIPVRDILQAVGLGEQAEEILAEAREYREMQKLLQSPVTV